jgi:hypothetical protein
MNLPAVKTSLRRGLHAAALLLTAVGPAAAQETFRAANVSARYDAVVEVAGCGGADQDFVGSACGGPGKVSLYRKGSKRPFQVLRLPNLWLNRETAAHGPETAEPPRGLYAEEYGLVFEDFNFDGREDLAVCNGRDAGYGGPSYTVFLFDPKSGRFVENGRLSGLAEGPYLGLFFPDPKKKTLTAYSKSGCCYHETATFKVVGNRPVLVEQVIEDATPTGGADEGFVLVTTRKRVGRRWVERSRRVKREEGGQPD